MTIKYYIFIIKKKTHKRAYRLVQLKSSMKLTFKKKKKRINYSALETEIYNLSMRRERNPIDRSFRAAQTEIKLN